MTGYTVKITYCSKELSARDRVAIKDTTNAVSLDDATKNGNITIDMDYYAKLSVHNEYSEDKDYEKYIIVSKDGTKYVTGSSSFVAAMEKIVEEMADSGEDYQIEVYRMPSKNYKGKEFLTCSIV